MQHFTEKYPNLSLPQIKAVAALAAGQTMSGAADAAGVHRATLHDWRQQPDFLQAITDARCLATAALLDELKHVSRLALDAVKNLLAAEGVPPTVRLRAALAVLNRLQEAGHQGWALPQPAQETHHIKAETGRLHKDVLKTEAAKRKLPNPARQFPTDSALEVDFSEFHLPARPSAPCPCQSGKLYLACCLPKQFTKAA